MKVLRIISSLEIGGAERSIVGNVPIHIKNGYEMDVLLLNGTETFFLKELEREGVRIIKLGENNNIYNPFLIFKLINFLNKYDLIHVHLFPSLYWVAFAKMISRSKTKLIFTEHNTGNRRRDNWIFKKIDNIVYRQYETIIAISGAAHETLTKHLIYPANIVTVHNGVDLAKVKEEGTIKPNKFSSRYREKKVLLQIASFESRKDQDTLIRALSFLPDFYVVVFIGDGKRRVDCEKLSRELNVQDRVDFLGLQSNVGAYIRLSEVVIMSSHVEGFGRAAVEGMALGKPVIASNVIGLADVVKGAGLLFEAGDHEQLAKTVLRLTEDKGYYESIAQKCYERAEMFDIAHMVEQYENIYDTVTAT